MLGLIKNERYVIMSRRSEVLSTAKFRFIDLAGKKKILFCGTMPPVQPVLRTAKFRLKD